MATDYEKLGAFYLGREFDAAANAVLTQGHGNHAPFRDHLERYLDAHCELGQDLPAREQMNPKALAAYHKAEIDKWWPLIKAANLKAD